MFQAAAYVAYVVFAAAAVLLVYVLLHVPRRYRRFGPGQQQEAVDHSQGRFGGTYPEDLISSDEASERAHRRD